MKNTITLCICLLCTCTVFGQFKATPATDSRPVIDKTNTQINSAGIHRTAVTATATGFPYESISPFGLQSENLSIFRDPVTQLPLWIKGTPGNMDRSKTTPEAQAYAYLKAIENLINIENSENEFVLFNKKANESGDIHLRFQQVFDHKKIYGSEIMLHQKKGQIQLFNGRYFPTPQIDTRTIAVEKIQAENIVKAAITSETTLVALSGDALQLIDGEPLQSELIIYHKNNQAHLTWHVKIIPNITNRWEYFIDAQTGNILDYHKNICQLFGWHEDHKGHQCEAHTDLYNNKNSEKRTAKTNENFISEETAFAPDLNNVTREIDVWREGNTWLMIDAKRNMYNEAQSNLPNDAVGIIGTFDAENNYPGQGTEINLVNHGNNSSWSRNEVSAHYNAGIAYEYFRTTFGRNSIKNQGENIFSVINVSDEDGSDMDNAFWNGETMFYGNGNQAFTAPLAKALDVAGHEMAHGVVQSTANLVYQGESGAMNESFADIFGAMIDREDWKIGEEVANPNVFPTGTMRDMANPNNGGNSNNFYWQPAHYNERFTGSQDNGGVHINSGIPNYAYYLFATSNGVGKFKAEQVFFKALDDYLVMSSRFVDLRIAVIQAAMDLHGNGSSEVAAAAAAFDAVGILGDQPGGDYQNDAAANPGDDFIVWSDAAFSNILTGTALPSPNTIGAFTQDDHISRPSMSDDGTAMTYVHSDGSIRYMELDWSSGNPEITGNFNLNSDSNWRNIVVSKDGNKIAALFGDLNADEFDNEILVYDFLTDEGRWFVLSNPTTADGLSTGDVLYADALEFDITGQYLLYDAFNQIPSTFGEDISYWDIGIVQVWDNNTNSFTDSEDPQISKLFNNLGDQVSVGNPTFAKNSPYIIAFDQIESGFFDTEYSVQGVNIQTGDQGLIFNNNKPGYPSYSVSDEEILFSVNNNNQAILGYRDLNDDKILGIGDPFILIEDAAWGAWYAIGARNLTHTADIVSLDNDYTIVPNPTSGRLTISYQGTRQVAAQIELLNNLGQVIAERRAELIAGSVISFTDLIQVSAGSYFIKITTSEGTAVKRVIKQ